MKQGKRETQIEYQKIVLFNLIPDIRESEWNLIIRMK